MHQELYDSWARGINHQVHDLICMDYSDTDRENIVARMSDLSTILDIGCGTGHRTFNRWMKRGLTICGIEKFQNLITGSDYEEHIIQGDIADPNFDALFPAIREKLQLQEGEKISVVVLFGSVVESLLDESLREMAWANFAKLLEFSNRIVFDVIFDNSYEFYTAERGIITEPMGSIPHQYCYSFREIQALNAKHGLAIYSAIDDIFGYAHRRQFFTLMSFENTELGVPSDESHSVVGGFKNMNYYHR
jgi:SAM-dependent methyltransferase